MENHSENIILFKVNLQSSKVNIVNTYLKQTDTKNFKIIFYRYLKYTKNKLQNVFKLTMAFKLVV